MIESISEGHRNPSGVSQSPALLRRSYSVFSARLHQTARDHHLPLVGSFELTFRCNFDCVHCYEQDVRDTPELSTERWLELVDEVADAGCLWLTLTGGEAILHPGFEAIYERATQRGMLITVFSNGSTLSERIAQLFKRLPPRSIEVTLYGASPKTYLESTGRARNYQLAFSEPFLFDRPITVGGDIHKQSIIYPYAYTQSNTGGAATVGFQVGGYARLFGTYSFDQIRVSDVYPVYLPQPQLIFTPSEVYSSAGLARALFIPSNGELAPSNPYMADLLLLNSGGKRTISKVTPSYVYNSVDNPIFRRPVGG